MGIRNLRKRLPTWLGGQQQRAALDDAPPELDALDDDVVILDPPGTLYPRTVNTTHPLTERTGRAIITAIEAIPGGGGGGAGDASAANQVTEISRLTSILAKLDVALSTRASESTIASILAKLIAAPATEAKQDSLITANHADLAAILAKLITAPSTEAKQDAEAALIGSLTETAPATDTASSGLNGRLQRLAQRLTSLIAQLPVGLGQQTMAGSLAVVLASNQSTLPVSAASLPLPTGAATETTLGTRASAATQTDGTQRSKITDGTNNAAVKAASTAPLATDPALVVALSPNSLALTISSEVEVKNDTGNPIPVSASSLPLPTGAATESTLDARTGSLTETAPATDTASSGINGRLQRIAQRITSFIGLFPTTIGQKAKAASLAIALPTDQVGAAGTPAADVISVQGVASMTPLKVDGSGVTQPVSASSLPLPTGAATEATLATRAAAGTQTDGTQRTKITDGTTNAAVKAASTAAVAADPALVVSISPNTPISVALSSEVEVKNDTGNPVPISASSLPLPTGAATEATLDARTGSLTETAPATDTASSGINGRLQRIAQRITSLIALFPSALGQTTSTASFPVVVASDDAVVGSRTETAPISDNAASGLNGRLQRVCARITSLIALLPASLGQKAMSSSLAVTVASDQSTLTVSAATLPLPTGAATEATLDARTGSLTETAPASDTASSGLNGRLQRIAQRLTSLISATGSPFQAGGSIGNTTFASTVADGANVTVGAKADAKSTATDTTAITIMSVLKQVSFSIQAAASSLAGTLTVAAHAVTNAGVFAVQATIAAAAASIGKAEDVASADADVGVPAMAIRKGTPGNTSGTDGDYEMLQMSAGKLWVDGSSVTQPVSAATLPLPSGAATETSVAATAAVAGTTGGAAVITDANGTLQQYLRGIVKLLITILPASLGQKVKASSLAVTLASDQDTLAVSLASVPSHNVTNAGIFDVQATVAAGATTIGKAEDAASANADVGVPAMAIQKATPADTAGTDGDYSMLQMKNGLLFTDGSKVTQPVSASTLPLPSGAATAALQSNVQRANNVDAVVGDKAISVQGLQGYPVNVVGDKKVGGDFSPLRFKDLGAHDNALVKGSAGNVYSLSCHNHSATKVRRYIQLHNTVGSLTSGTSVPLFSFLIPSDSQIIVGTDFFTNEGAYFDTGITFAVSSTLDVYTNSTSADQSTWINYK